jgi:hypothetical protein
MLCILDRFITSTTSGETIPSATVTVTDSVTLGLADLYDDIDGATPVDNPLTADSNGRITAYLKAGRYNLTATSGAFTTEYNDVVLSNEILSDENGFTIKNLSQPFSGDRYYSINVGRNLGDSYKPYVTVSSISKDGSTTYFDEELATLDYVNSSISANEIVTKSTSTFDLDPADVGKIVRATYVGTKTMTIQPEATLPQSANAFYYVTNRSSGLLTVALGSGVTLNKPANAGGYTTLQVQRGETIKITRVTTDNYDVEISPGNHGLGGFSIFQTGVSNDYTDQRGSGFIAFGSGYNAGIATTTSSSPVLHMEVSENGAAQFLSILPSSAGANDGKLGYRDRTGAVWSPISEVQTTKTTANVNYSAIYDNFVSTNGGVTIRLRVWCGDVSKEAHAVAEVAGTATTGTAGSALPSLSTSILASKIYPKYGTITIPFYTVSGGNTVASGYLKIDTSGTVTYSIINGTAYGASQFESRYVCT